MPSVTPYLNFAGNCREAMNFYKSCFGGELQFMTYGEFPSEAPPGDKDQIMHSSLKAGNFIVMASDCPPGMPLTRGTNIQLSLDFNDTSECEKLFAALSQGGTVAMPLQQTSWAHRFGMVTCRFGINWMVNVHK